MKSVETDSRVMSVEPVDNEPVECEHSDRTCCDAFFSVLGWAFEIVTVLISLSDIASDILVAAQFYSEGEYLWFWLVVGTLIVSDIIYSIVLSMFLTNSRSKYFPRFPPLLMFFIVLPIGQLGPILYWALEQLRPSQVGVPKPTEWSVSKKDAAVIHNRALQQEVEAIATSAKTMERVERTLFRHLRTHLMLYIETVAESIPQSVIQLLAITFLGRVTLIQALSMALSLYSIISKGYVLSHSFTVRMFILKFMAAAHDLFSLFYVFSSILSKDAPQEMSVPFFHSISVSTLSWIWIVKTYATIGIGTLLCICVGLAALVQSLVVNKRKCSWETARECGLAIGAYILGSIPVLVAMEGAKLIWSVLLFVVTEPRVSVFPSAATLYSFCHGGQSYSDRIRHVVFERYQMQQDEFIAELVEICLDESFHPRHLHTKLRKPKTQYGGSRLERCLQVVFVVVVILYTISQIFSLVFPFVDVGLHYRSLNLLQIVCFASLSVALIIALSMVPHAWSYWWFSVELQRVFAHPSNSGLGCGLGTVHRWIADYYLPPCDVVLRGSIPAASLPIDVSTVVASYMSPSEINTSQLSIEEFQAMTCGLALWSRHKLRKPPPASAAEAGARDDGAPDGTQGEQPDDVDEDCESSVVAQPCDEGCVPKPCGPCLSSCSGPHTFD